MKKLITILVAILFASLLLTSCKSKKGNNALAEYCECIKKNFNDSLISTAPFDSFKKVCFNSIITDKYKLNNDKDFLSKIDTSYMIKKVSDDFTKTVNLNISKFLIKNTWSKPDMGYNYSTGKSFLLGKYILTFDGKMVSYDEIYDYNKTKGNLHKGTYTVQIESNGLAYVYIIFDGDNTKETYKLVKNAKGHYCLEGTDVYWKD